MSHDELLTLFQSAGANLTTEARRHYKQRLDAAATVDDVRGVILDLLADATETDVAVAGLKNASDIGRLWRAVTRDWRAVRDTALAGLADQSNGPHVCDCGCTPPHSNASQCARNRESTRLYMRRVNGFDQRGA